MCAARGTRLAWISFLSTRTFTIDAKLKGTFGSTSCRSSMREATLSASTSTIFISQRGCKPSEGTTTTCLRPMAKPSRLTTLSDLCLIAPTAEDHGMLCRSAIEVFEANKEDCMLSMVYTSSGPTPRCVYTSKEDAAPKELADLTLHGHFCIEPNHSE